MSVLFNNNASSRITAALTAGDIAVQVTAGEGAKFPSPAPGDHFMLTLEDRRSRQIEICKCTSRTGDSLYVTRAQEGTAAQAFAIGATASNRLTAGTIFDIFDWSYSKSEADARYVNVVGDTMTGPLVLPGDPVAPLQSATKQYVDNRLASLPVYVASKLKSLVYMVDVETTSIDTATTMDIYGQTYTFDDDDAFDIYINGLREFASNGTYGGYLISLEGILFFTDPILAGSSVVIDVFRTITAEPVVSVYKLAPIVPDGMETVFAMAIAGTGEPVDALSSAEVQVHVNNVPQQPDVDYTALGATLTFVEAPEADADVWGVWVKTEN
jgi:hypothetical protein